MATSDLAQEMGRPLWLRLGHVGASIAVLALLIAVGNFVFNLQESRLAAREKVELIGFASSLRARIDRELTSVLFLTSGLKSYLTVRHGNLDRGEVQDILASLFQMGRHLRNLAIAEGYRVTYIHPIEGNKQAIGLYYPDLPQQWPQVKQAAETGKSVLVGPVDLVQGGQGLIYRVPVFIRNDYWGMLSTVINTDSLFRSAFTDIGTRNIVFALRGKNGQGMQGEVFWGQAALFDDPDAEILELEIPGGKWAIATRFEVPLSDGMGLWGLRALGLLFALFLSWGTYVLLTQRAQLMRMALFDPLTGLPNRHLIEDRIAQAITGQRRNRTTVCLLLFIDLDGFKNINDRYGHKAGDAVLQGVAKRVQDAVREADTVGRWGGDEIIVLLENVDRRKIPQLIDSIRKAAESSLAYGAHKLQVGASIGAALAPDNGESLGELVRTADSNMYEDKQKRRAAKVAH
jgi:diguanylate cyclase (GGDEF)-like protein